MSRTAPGSLMDTNDWFAQRPRILKAVLAVMFILAALVRLYDLDAPGMLVDRDYTSAMFARDFYFSRSEEIAPWRREIARKTHQNQPILEPPITEWLVSWTYNLVGEEQLRSARILTSLFWLAGGIFLFSIARSLVSAEGGVFALGFYLFLPLSVLLSRSFQPDSLMMLLFLASLWSIIRYYEHPGTGALLFAALLAAVTLVYRPLVLLPLLGAFALPQIECRGLWRGAFSRPTLIYVTVSCLPMLLYYGYATFVAKYFGWKLATSFRFDLWAHHEYWLGWFDLAVDKLGLWALIAAAIGFVFLRPGLPRAIVTG
ncbi:MAG TPA: glycosyltransferase family 39 protein, partial [Gammaproteobacteria bacterium]|nr:glycosyltransferase family 39 protein [Gammaproteobacteria bacterium]